MNSYADKEGKLVEVVRREDGVVHFRPAGGGRESALPSAVFRRKFRQQQPQQNRRRT